jgi:calcineurin-like phosphoesterase family protein
MTIRLNAIEARSLFFTADSHFGHDNIIKLADRPFGTAIEMDNEMIRRWNSAVTESDTVIHLGDFTLGGPDAARYYFSRLNGQIMVLSYEWHHDCRWLRGGPYHSATWQEVKLLPPLEVVEISLPGREHRLPVTLCHYPLSVWDRAHYGGWHLHGHVHGKPVLYDYKYAIDVGVDVDRFPSFTPVSYSKIAWHMGQRGWR